MKRDIHAGGRPKINRPDSFYQEILSEYETMTINQMASAHSVSRSTIARWLRIARNLVAAKEV